MVNIGFDTVRFHKAFHLKVVKELIEPRIGYGQGKTKWFNGFMLFRNPRNSNSFSFQNSFAKYGSEEGNNLVPANMDVMKRGIARFEEETGLEVHDADVSRLDVAMNMETEHEPRLYRGLLREYNSYKFPEKEFENSGYMESGEKSLVMYDKKKEMEEKGKEDGRLDGVQNLLRLELQMKRHVERHMGLKEDMAPLSLGLLSEVYGYVGGVRAFEKTCIKLLALNQMEKEKGKAMTRQAIECDATLRVMASHQSELESMLRNIMEENNVGKDVYDAVMEGYEKRKKKEKGKEIYECIRKGCDAIYGEMGMVQETVDHRIEMASYDIMEKMEKVFKERTMEKD